MATRKTIKVVQWWYYLIPVYFGQYLKGIEYLKVAYCIPSLLIPVQVIAAAALTLKSTLLLVNILLEVLSFIHW